MAAIQHRCGIVIINLLDIRTLSLIAVLFCFLYGIGLCILAYQQERFVGLGTVGVSDLLIGAGFLLIVFRELISDLFSILLANVLVLAGFMTTCRGICKFLGLPAPPRLYELGLMVILIAGFYHYTFVDPYVPARIIIISALLTIAALWTGFALVHRMPPNQQLAHIMTALPFFLFGFYCIVRLLWSLYESQMQTLMNAGAVHALAFLFIDIQILLSSFGLLWLTSLRLEQKLRNQARRDHLTGLYNRRAMEEIAEREIARSKRTQSTFSTIMFDLDHFKKINDDYGHHAGDAVLVSLARLVMGRLRLQDVAVRFGGEEFLLLLPETNAEQAMNLAEQLRRLVEEMRVVVAGSTITVTASFGVATQIAGKPPWNELVHNTDQAMYTSKNDGRNRVTLAGNQLPRQSK